MECKWCNIKKEHLKIKEYEHWNLFLAESQDIIGWSHAVLKRHALFFEELYDEELSELKTVISDLKAALDKILKPDWFNVMQFGNIDPHIHFHLVPRYKEKREYSGMVFKDSSFGKMPQDEWPEYDKDFLEMLAKDIKNMI